MKHFIFVIAACSLTAASCGVPNSTHSTLWEAWNSRNDPAAFGASTRKLANLPLSGALAHFPWTDYYWAHDHGGLAWRWQQPGANSWSATLMGRDQLRSMSREQIAALSPAEKYDILQGKYDYPLTLSERRRTGPTMPSWYGLCHGKAAAQIIELDEPLPTDVRNSDGIVVPFGASDIKALLIYVHGEASWGMSPMAYLGERCNSNLSFNPSAALMESCRDINPGSFHIALTNEIGLRKRGFVLDIDPSEEVWNTAVASYQSNAIGERQPSAGAASGTVREMVMSTTISFAQGIQPQWQPTHANASSAGQTKNYQYALELNAAGDIIGGSWLSYDHPDFAWSPNSRNPNDYLVGNFADVRRLLRPSGLPIITPVPTEIPRPIITPLPTEIPQPIITPLPTEIPQPVVTVLPGSVETETISFGSGAAVISLDLRRDRTYSSSDWINVEGIAPRGVIVKLVLSESGVEVARSFTNLITGSFHLRFQAGQLGWHHYVINGLDSSSQLIVHGDLRLNVVP